MSNADSRATEQHACQQLAEFTLSAGKYRDRQLQNVPHRYLEWIQNEKPNLPPADKWAANEYLRVGGRGREPGLPTT